MKMIILAVAAAALLAGCVSTKQVMVDPVNGQTKDCSAFGFGLIGVPVALGMQAECEKKMKESGMVTSEDFQKSGGVLTAKKE